MNVFDLAARITLDTSDYEKGLDDASKKSSSLASKIGSGLKTAAKIGAVALTAAATGVAALTKTSLDNYAEYEQLVGGVETLFSKSTSAADEFAESISGNTDAIKEFQRENNLAVDGIIGPNTLAAIEERFGEVVSISTEGADIVKENAANAFKTAGMSANQYMETVTGFSASLIQSLGGDTKKAASVADTAITDMADNANKMGTSMELIQNAYQGFAKQNYTMLDNLKLGYGGTKEEMARLIEDANKVKEANGEMADLSIDSFADIVEAIHTMQEEMGIAGTTAKEASSTIQGSVASMKAAWSNLLTGIADDNADIDSLINNLVDSVVTAAGNIIPRVSKILSGIGGAIKKLSPIISKQIPAMLNSVLPSLISAAGSLLTSFASALPGLLPPLADAAIEAAISIVGAITQNLPDILSSLFTAVSNAVDAMIGDLGDKFPAIASILNTLKDVIPVVVAGFVAYESITKAVAIAQGLLNAVLNANPFVLIISLIAGLVIAFKTLWETNEGFRDAVIEIWEKVKTAFSDAVDFIKSALDSVKEFFGNLLDGIKEKFADIKSWFSEKFNAAKEAVINAWNDVKSKFSEKWGEIKEAFAETKSWFKDKFASAKDAAVNAWNDAKSKFSEKWAQIKEAFSETKSWFKTKFADAKNAASDAWNDVKSKFKTHWEGIKGEFGDVVSWFSEKFTSARDSVYNAWSTVVEWFRQIWEGIQNAFSAVANVLGGFFSDAWDAITGVWDDVTWYFSDIWNGIRDTFSAVPDTISGFFSDAWAAITGIADGWADYFEGIWEDIKTKFSSAIDKIKGFFNFDWSLPKIKLPHFSITGEFNLWPPSVPHIGVEWYKKAMDNAMLLNGATIFGASGNKLLGGGEAGPEVVSGADTLMKMISKSVKSAMGTQVVNITVNGANIQDEQKLAEMIAFQFQMIRDREAMAYGS